MPAGWLLRLGGSIQPLFSFHSDFAATIGSMFRVQYKINAAHVAVLACLAMVLPTTVFGHQLSTVNGTTVQHTHVYKRNNYGQGITTGHVAPTPHGNDMVIWSPAPAAAYGKNVPRLQITQPRRRSNSKRSSGNSQYLQPDNQAEAEARRR